MYQTNFPKRAKGQRYDKPLLPSITRVDGDEIFDAFGDKALGTVKIVGDFNGYDGFGIPTVFEHVEVFLNDGTIVPAYRIKSPEKNYNVCQAYTYKAIRP